MSGEKEELSEKDEDKSWEKKKKLFISKEDVDGTVDITLANQIYIKSHNTRTRALKLFRRLAAFRVSHTVPLSPFLSYSFLLFFLQFSYPFVGNSVKFWVIHNSDEIRYRFL